MEIKDIHTHHANQEAIQNVSFHSFVPQPDCYYSVGIHPWDISSGEFISPEEQKIITEKPEIIAKEAEIIVKEQKITADKSEKRIIEETKKIAEELGNAGKEQKVLGEKQKKITEEPKILTEKQKQIAEELEKIAKHPQVIAIGEAGLDRLISTDLETQTNVFEQQIQLAEQIEKPLIIHAVRTFNELIRLKQKYKPSVAWIIHGFRGNKQIAEQLVKHGFYLSFGEKYQQEALRQTPLNRIFIETDESTQSIHSLYRKAAEALSIPLSDFSESIRENIRQVFFSR